MVHAPLLRRPACSRTEPAADYQGFASEHPEQLAKAIEHGIPKTLRGMIWQLM